MPSSWLPTPTPVGREQQQSHHGSEGDIFNSDVFTDGSLRQRQWWAKNERAGWRIITLEAVPSTGCAADMPEASDGI